VNQQTGRFHAEPLVRIHTLEGFTGPVLGDKFLFRRSVVLEPGELGRQALDAGRLATPLRAVTAVAALSTASWELAWAAVDRLRVMSSAAARVRGCCMTVLSRRG
jgi:hypothetical protein